MGRVRKRNGERKGKKEIKLEIARKKQIKREREEREIKMERARKRK